VRTENENAPRQGRVETAEHGKDTRPASDCKTAFALGRCARCGVRVSEKNFGTASHGKFLLLWCDRCTAENQQPTLELAGVPQ
jgi:hypothetical protein